MDLSTTYLGLELKSPLVCSAGPLSGSVETIRQAEAAGAGALVMHSLFEEQLRHEENALDHFLSYGTESFAEALGYFPAMDDFVTPADTYMETLAKAAAAGSMPIIGSLNGVSAKGWIEYASRMADAGAAAIELNVYYIPTDPDEIGGSVEARYLDALAAVRKAVDVPVAMKLGPYFSSTANMAKRLADAGADGLVLFNRFYQPDFDLNKLEVAPTLSLSTPAEVRLPLLWIAILSSKIDGISLAASTGVHAGTDIAKYLLAGANVAMSTSALLQNGVAHVSTMLAELKKWMQVKGYDSVDEMRGAMNMDAVADAGAFTRANYIKILETFKRNDYIAR